MASTRAGSWTAARAGVGRRLPATMTMLAAIVFAGLLTGGLWSPFADSHGWEMWAYGLPAFEDGRWWTVLTGTFLVMEPWMYPLVLTSLWGLAYLEWKRGWRVAAAYYAVGQLFAVLGAALLVWALAEAFSLAWAEDLSRVLDVGPSGGGYACMAAAIGLFPAPWRNRAWLVLLTTVVSGVILWGEIADVEHALGVLLILGATRTLRIQRSSVREQRMLAFVGLLFLIGLNLFIAIAPTNGPFGETEPLSGVGWRLVINTAVILLIANELRTGRRWAWWTTGLIGVLNVLAATVAVAARQLGLADVLSDNVELAVAVAALWVAFLLLLWFTRRAFGARRHRMLRETTPATRADMIRQLRTFGGGTMSWMTTWEPQTYFRSDECIVAYQVRAGVAIALTGPIGPAHRQVAAVRSFIAHAERSGLTPCFFSAAEAIRSQVPDQWQGLLVADDTLVDLPGLQFTGKKWGPVRTAVNRAQREQIEFRLTRLADAGWGTRLQLRSISELWVGDKGLPEMRFTLGTLAEAEDAEVRVAVALSPGGTVDGFLSWLPIYGPGGVRGWTLDLMRRRPDGFGPVIEYLIGMSATAFRDQGAELMSLSGAPLAHEYPPEAGAIAALSGKLADVLEPVYGFQSLHHFKQKFNPRYEPMYLLYRDATDLPRIGAALTRAFLPDATIAQFASAGADLLRRR